MCNYCIYLKDGIGNPWALQRRDSWVVDFTIKVLDLSSLVNLGLELPIGSVKNQAFYIPIYYVYAPLELHVLK